MERLQAAIEKAREQRAKAVGIQRQPERGAVPTRSTFSDDEKSAWIDLELIKLNRARLKRARVVSLDGGSEAAPFDMLRTRVLQQAAQKGWRRIAITSPDSSCGKTTTVANLAFCLERQRDVRSLVLDFDLRRSGLSKLLAQKPDHSMVDVLEGRVKFANHGLRYGESLAFGLNNSAFRYPSELLQSLQTSEVLDELEQTYKPDIVLFDLPPMMASDDNFGFLKNVDCALLIAGAEKTSMDKIDVAERQIAEITNVMGIVLNKSRYLSGAYGYDYGYY